MPVILSPYKLRQEDLELVALETLPRKSLLSGKSISSFFCFQGFTLVKLRE